MLSGLRAAGLSALRSALTLRASRSRASPPPRGVAGEAVHQPAGPLRLYGDLEGRGVNVRGHRWVNRVVLAHGPLWQRAPPILGLHEPRARDVSRGNESDQQGRRSAWLV